MEKFIVSGGNRLYGKTRLKGAKNSILPLLAGALLTREKVTIRDCPDISDVAYMCEIIKSLGADVVRAGDEITISGGAKNGDVPESLAHEIRSSVFLMGSLVATLGRARIAYPGGCDIGLRPVDIHIRALKELNIKIDEQSGYINCATDGIVGADVGLDKISVGATENIMMAAVLGKGTTIIRNAAKEPEITDLQNMLNKMGAKVRGGNARDKNRRGDGTSRYGVHADTRQNRCGNADDGGGHCGRRNRNRKRRAGTYCRNNVETRQKQLQGARVL